VDNPQPLQPDWLDDESVAASRTARNEQRVEFARNYLVFETDARARALLEHWDATVLRRRTPVGASLQQYAADEAIRAFVGGIHDELRIAREGKV
jgi:hypothetical protein